MAFGDGRGISATAAQGLITTALNRGTLQQAKSEINYDYTALPGYSTYFTSPPTGWTDIDVFGDTNGFWRTNLTNFGRLPSGSAAYAIIYVDASRPNDSGSGATPELAKQNIGTQLTNGTNLTILARGCGVDIPAAVRAGNWGAVLQGLKSGFAFNNSQSPGGTDIGADKVVRAYPGTGTVLMTGFYTFADLVWTYNTNGAIWQTTTVTSSTGGVLDFGQFDVFGQPVRAIAVTSTARTITNVVDNGAGISRVTAVGHTFTTGGRVVIHSVTGSTSVNGTWQVTVIDADTFDVAAAFSAAYVSGGSAVSLMPVLAAAPACITINGVIYYANGSTTTAPNGAKTFISIGSNRYKHDNPARALHCTDCAFLGGSITFSSTCGQFIVSGVNNAGTYRITTASAHGFSNGDTVTIEGMANVAAGVNAAHVISGVTSTTFDIPIAFTTTATDHHGIANKLGSPIQSSFFGCAFGFGFSASSNVAQFEGHGLTVLQDCVAFASSTDIIDYRARRWAVEERCFFRGAGAQNPSSSLNQASTGHSGSRVFTLNSELSGCFGPAIQDVRERNVDSYRVTFGNWLYDVRAASASSQSGLFVGTDSSNTDASIMWSIDNIFASPQGLSAPTYDYTVATGSGMYINAVVVATRRTVLGTPAINQYYLM